MSKGRYNTTKSLRRSFGRFPKSKLLRQIVALKEGIPDKSVNPDRVNQVKIKRGYLIAKDFDGAKPIWIVVDLKDDKLMSGHNSYKSAVQSIDELD